MRYLAVDLGDKRTGLALGDDHTNIASPLAVLEVSIDDNDGLALLNALAKAIDHALGPPARVGLPDRGCVLFGLPLNMDGTEGPASTKVRAFAAKVASQTGHTILFHDERLSTAQADWSMAQSGLTRGQKKARRDALAAAEILKTFLMRDQQPSTQSPANPATGSELDYRP